MIPDSNTRQTALNTQQSFIVQAPAGSGKTELLVQRFLALLAQAERSPEEIIAITFTKKAASEMRQRITQALASAKDAAPLDLHAYQTWMLANAALQRDQTSAWHVLENPNRLRILTIDAFCHSIAKQAPLLSGVGVFSQPLETDIENYYLEAARRLLAILEENSPVASHLAYLLLHLDNQVELAETLFVRMLARRDQWLPHLMSQGKTLNSTEFKLHLEAGLANIAEEALLQCYQHTPSEYHQELMILLQFSQEFRTKREPLLFIENPHTDKKNIRYDKHSAYARPPYEVLNFPDPSLEFLPIWLDLAHLLLTQNDTWRSKVTKRDGFPSDQKDMKQRMESLLKKLSSQEMLRHHLAALRHVPPVRYDESQWRLLEALSSVLPLLVAELKVLFKERGVCDFNEVAMAAITALDDSEFPTDLALILDAQIRHLLVDEFQDTSITQFHLLEKLTAGWQEKDGRTLFLVGDPMQSIYSFREAEVGLFLKAQQEGIGAVKLHTLQLETNFRSTPELIAWINRQFTDIFPKQADISMGAIPFSPCVAIQSSHQKSGVFLHAFSTKNADVETLLSILQTIQAEDSDQTVAILVRSRTHLEEIVPALKRAHLNFTAVEIEALYKQMIVQDLLSLTGALLHLGDRLSWLSVLRSPWCGLTLCDLHAIANHQPEKTIWENLNLFTEIKRISEDGYQKIGALVPVLQQALMQRGRKPFRVWIEKTWRSLKGPECVIDFSELASSDAYFKLLEQFDKTGETPTIEVLQQVVLREYATPSAQANSRLHVMTIHKAKGLEFDVVIIPHLELKSQSDKEQLLLWLDRPRAEKENELILAPIKARHQARDPIYGWLQQIFRKKMHYEKMRLLYVATTRAKKQLHLMATLEKNVKKPEPSSFLSMFWKAFAEHMEN
jgi:ATP-dependent helicase/nuclease subunit A